MPAQHVTILYKYKDGICSTSNIIMWAVKPPERKPSQEEDEIDDDEDNALKVGNLYCVVSRLRVRFLAEKKPGSGAP